jgi:glycosyltransferase involved in cell wall biosynthesis
VKILFVSSTFPNPFNPHKGSFNLDTVRQLRADHDIRVVCPIGWTEPDRSRRSGGRPLASDANVTHVTYYYPPRVLHAYRDVFLWWSIGGRLRTITRDWRPDLILAYWTHPDGFAARRLALQIHVPFVQIVGGSDVLVVARGLRRKKIVRMLRAADAVVTIGRNLGAEVAALGVPMNRVATVYRAVPETFSPGDQDLARRNLRLPPAVPVVLWVGRFVRVKGLEILIEAIRQLTRVERDVRVYLVGAGPEMERVRRLAGQQGLGEVVRFAGPVPHDQLVQWYRAADLTVLASHSEGVPNVLLESIACGTPFVATRVGSIPEIADPTIDRLVPPGDPAALSGAMAATLSLRARGAHQRRILATPEVVRAQFNAVFERVRQPFLPEPALAHRLSCDPQ